MFEVGNVLWIAIFRGSLPNLMSIGKFIDFQTFEWDEPCQYYRDPTNAFTSRQLPYGPDGDQSTHWSNLDIYFEYDITKVLYDAYTSFDLDFRVMQFNNRTASFRTQSGDCYMVSNPGFVNISDRLGEPNTAISGGFPVGFNNYSMMLSKFTHCGNFPITYTLKISPNTALPSFMSLDIDNLILNISPWDASFIKIYKLRLTGSLTESPSNSNYTEFQVEVIKNYPPNPKDFLKSAIIFAHHNQTWQIYLDNDLEFDEAYFNVSFLSSTNATITATWFIVSFSDNQGVEFSILDPPQPPAGSNLSQYYIRVNVSDQFSRLTPNLTFINLKIARNFSPFLSPIVNQTIESIYITKSFSYTLWYQNFTDNENDQVIIDCQVYTTALNKDWITIEVNNTMPGNITFFGQTPRDNRFAGIYTFKCSAEDQYDGALNIYNFTLNVKAKDKDPQNEPNYYSLLVNNTEYNNTSLPWLYWNNKTLEIYAHPFSNSQGGNHSISIKFEDKISQSVFINFTLEVIQNWPLVPVKQLNKILAITNTWFYYDFVKTQIFRNPEGEEFQMYFRTPESDNSLPYFISKNFSNGTIGGFTTEANIGTYKIECVGIDDALWETVVNFQLLAIINAFYAGTKTIIHAKLARPDITFIIMNVQNLAFLGHTIIRLIGNAQLAQKNAFNAQDQTHYNIARDAKKAFFILIKVATNNALSAITMIRLLILAKVNKISLIQYLQLVCAASCNSCYGPSTLQCNNCTEIFNLNEKGQLVKVGYSLVRNECRMPKCVDGKYFQWQNELSDGIHYGKCQICHSSCRKCVGPTSNDCIQCYSGNILDDLTFSCVACESIVGYFTNEEFECEDICGDGILRVKQCDDGNLKNGDGCNQDCQIEYGYSCPIPNTTCKEIISPTLFVRAITPLNLIYVEFSEGVQLTEASALSFANIEIKIEGTKSEYIFDWRIIEDLKNPLVPGRIIQRFQIKLQDLKTSLEGTENIKISLKNYSQVTDLAENSVTQDSFASVNPYPFIYFSPVEQSTAQNGGQSLKYTFLSVFSFNIALKILLNSSMQFLWGLVHALQVFNFLLYMNIDFPENVELFSNYLKVASGDIDEFNQFIPNIGDYIIDENQVNEAIDNEKLQQKFQDDEISPYFIIAFGQKLTLWVLGLLVILPIAVILNKLCKKMSLWENIIGFFFFNGPLRTFVEMYIELIMQVVINTQFIKYRNQSQIIATLTVFAFGAISLLLPFITMTVIYKNMKKIQKKNWIYSWGMLTEELRKKSILQLYYYPIFMFQRLIIVEIIVYLYDSPFIQCLAVAICNIMMILYLITVKPFHSESQQTTTVIDEFVILLCLLVFIQLGGSQMTQDKRKNLGWILIFLILSSVCKNFGVVLYFTVKES
ncbi:cadg multi-domain protein [Stylonychia lemnae]|uniref:Cadg multi-domain protein n=1 Tax=Stylonychia lemnae TaxID=5949 RepID=A0A078BBG8_STYLE|nr:cadg multi-domain protein [Stylonychia lemnae]|eukprot:CDW90898.1 cadg multi-domain protein [Stylonychia lemnae]